MIEHPSTSAYGLDARIAAGIASLLGPIGAIVILVGKPPETWVRFTAVQSLVFAAAWIAFSIVDGIVGTIVGAIPGVRTILGAVLALVGLVVALGALAIYVVVSVRAFTGKVTRVPVAATIADRWAA